MIKSPPRLETKRLVLRELTLPDFELHATTAADPVAMKHMSGVHDRRTAWRIFLAMNGQWPLTGAGWLAIEHEGKFAGTVGCYGGMSIAAALCSELIVTREARLGLNGPAVIEQEAGIAEFDSRDKPMIWRLTGGEQRYRSGLADRLVEDDATQVREAAIACFARGAPPLCRSERVGQFQDSLAHVDPGAAVTPEQVATIYGRRFAA